MTVDGCAQSLDPGMITLFSVSEGGELHKKYEFPATVSCNGSVQWLLPRIYTSSCTLDVTNFPWDTQTCLLIFGSWSYTLNEVDLVTMSAEADTDVYTPNLEWVLEEVPASRVVIFYNCCLEPLPIPNLQYSIVITRKPLYYVVNLVVPCSFVTMSGILAFCLPSDSGEKVSLSVTVLLSSTVFLLLLSEYMPTQSEVVPLAGQ